MQEPRACHCPDVGNREVDSTQSTMSNRPLRIAYARLFHEANVYSPLPTTRADFQRVQLIRGSALTERVRRDRWEIPGLIPWGELSGFEEAARRAGGVERLPLLSAMAIPSGKLTAAAYAELRDELIAGLEEVAPVDGVYLALHGSMRVAGMSGAPEADLLRAVRRVLGPAARIAISLDLHANLSAEIVAAADVIQSFRANPHWDLAPSGYRATRTLIGMLRGDVQPVSAWRKLPIVLGGGAGISFLTPARSVFRRMKRMARDRRVLNVSFNMVHPFSDADDLGWTTHVITDGDRDLAERLADELADAAWAIRRHPLPTFHSLEEALELVRHKSRLHGGLPSSLIDLGDNVLSGTSGGTNHLLGALLERAPNMRVYVPIHDPGLVEAARHRSGENVCLSSVGTPALASGPSTHRGARRPCARSRGRNASPLRPRRRSTGRDRDPAPLAPPPLLS